MSNTVGPWTAKDNALAAFAAIVGDLSRMAADEEDEFAENAEDLGAALMVAITQLGLADALRDALAERIAVGLTEADMPTIERWCATAHAWKRVQP